MPNLAKVDRFQIEREHRARGLLRLAGIDEAGRGPLAGPVVAAAAILPEEWVDAGIPESLQRLNDSKRLTEKVREELFNLIEDARAIKFGISIVDAGIIDQINILQATHRAMNDALSQLNPEPHHVLVDGNFVNTLTMSQTAIVKGDSKSFSIAAASILAKVTRDRLMCEFHKNWPEYGFVSHKGYGTAAHLEAIAAHGPCPIHRRSFAPLRTAQPELF